MQANTIKHRDAASPAGWLEVICGCMFAGKTEALIDRALALPPRRVQVFKHVIDDRYHPARVVSHRGRSYPAVAVARAAQMLEHFRNNVELVAIDEGHFFEDNLHRVCSAFVARGVSVLVTALDRDSWGRRFPLIDVLRAAADVVTVKTSPCARCGGLATRTQRLTPIIDNRIVGGPESFEPRCVQCWTPPPGSCDQMMRLASNTGPCVQHNS